MPANPVNDTRVAVFWESRPCILRLRPVEPSRDHGQREKYPPSLSPSIPEIPQLDALTDKRSGSAPRNVFQSVLQLACFRPILSREPQTFQNDPAYPTARHRTKICLIEIENGFHLRVRILTGQGVYDEQAISSRSSRSRSFTINGFCSVGRSIAMNTIKRTALNYAEGWYERQCRQNGERLSPDLAKRIARHKSAGTKQPRTDDRDDAGPVHAGWRRENAKEEQQRTSRSSICSARAATVKCEMRDWIDYDTYRQTERKWVIINVLSGMKPKKR